MLSNKTRPTTASVHQYLHAIEDPDRRRDCKLLNKMMREIVGEKGRLWGDSLVGFGEYHYRYASGREGDFFLTGFSSRKTSLTVYIMPGFEKYQDQLGKLGRHKLGKSCLYLKSLAEVDLSALREMISDSVAVMRATYPD